TRHKVRTARTLGAPSRQVGTTHARITANNSLRSANAFVPRGGCCRTAWRASNERLHHTAVCFLLELDIKAIHCRRRRVSCGTELAVAECTDKRFIFIL